MEHFSTIQAPAAIGTAVSRIADGMTTVTREYKPSVGPSLTCVSGTALPEGPIQQAHQKSCDAFDLWSFQIMLYWCWFSSRKRRLLNMDCWRVCLVYPKLDKATKQHYHSGRATFTIPECPIPKGGLWQTLGARVARGQRQGIHWGRKEPPQRPDLGAQWVSREWCFTLLVSLVLMGSLSPGRSEGRPVMPGGCPSDVLAIQGHLGSLSSQELCGSFSDIRHILGVICKSQMAGRFTIIKQPCAMTFIGMNTFQASFPSSEH